MPIFYFLIPNWIRLIHRQKQIQNHCLGKMKISVLHISSFKFKNFFSKDTKRGTTKNVFSNDRKHVQCESHCCEVFIIFFWNMSNRKSVKSPWKLFLTMKSRWLWSIYKLILTSLMLSNKVTLLNYFISIQLIFKSKLL
jgi:hypothetical protein